MTDRNSGSENKYEQLIEDTLSIQSKAIVRLVEQDTVCEIENVARIIDKTNGRVIFTGIGKSGDVARKIAATFNSIGIASHFIHPVEAMHGDFGAISEADTVVLISNSGNTNVVMNFCQILRSISVTSIAITSNPSSKLGQRADYHINTYVEEEGSVFDLVPMTSATVTMVIGDCLANVLMERQNFTKEEYGRRHPGGIIGKQLLLNVEDILSTDITPTNRTDTLAEVAVTMSEGGKGIAVVQDEARQVIGVVTDGDIRRLLESGEDIHSVTAEQVMTTEPIIVSPDTSATSALDLIKEHSINHLIVTEDGTFQGVVSFHDIAEEGLTNTG